VSDEVADRAPDAPPLQPVQSAVAEGRETLQTLLDRSFLGEKVKRQGYAVLEDVELLSRSLLEVGEPALVERCVALVEGLREVVGGDVIEEARQAVRGYRPGPPSFRSRVVAPRVPAVPGLDVYVGMLPRLEVGADFFELVPHDGRLVVAIGDAPGAGLKSSFIARFLGNVFRRLVEQSRELHLGQILDDMQKLVGAHDYFETVDLQCAAIDPGGELLLLANADCPFPVLYSPRRGRCDRLPLRGAMLVSGLASEDQARHEQRQAEMEPGDVLLMVSDGLTEGHCLKGDAYGYRFTRLLEQHAGLGARALGEAILDDWRAHPREGDYADDVTILVVRIVP
jgi:serine phosphatase RsbU (regulator of sigma subunit)